jgi:predicted Zn-dependent protease
MAWGITAAAIGALMVGIWFSMDLLVGWAVDRIPLDWERRIGESAYQDFLIQHPAVKDGPAVAAVQEISERLIAHIPGNPYTFEVAVVKSEVVNAFALPGGYVVVFTALLQQAENAEEVAGVLSHELNHVLERHALQRIVKQLGLVTTVGIIIGDQQGLARVMKQIGVELLSLKFGRSQETEADVTGLQLLHRSHIDPSGMITFFQRMTQKERGGVEWLSTHPMSAGRAQRLEAEIARLPKTAAEPFTFKWNTKTHSGRSQSGGDATDPSAWSDRRHAWPLRSGSGTALRLGERNPARGRHWREGCHPVLAPACAGDCGIRKR